MSRLCFRVEGPTEQVFARKVLAPHLAKKSVIVTDIKSTALGRKHGLVHRGGVVRYEPLKNDLLRMLREDQGEDVFFTTMIDLYRLPNTFPGYMDAAAKADPYDRVAALEHAFEKDIGDRRFIAYIQLHEFEALLFAQPERFDEHYGEHEAAIASLVDLRKEHSTPELIDDGENTAPSKRIGEVIPRYLKEKPIAGPIIAAKIGIERIRQECSHFNEWLAKLEKLGDE